MDLSDLEKAAERQDGEQLRDVRNFCKVLLREGSDDDYTWGYTVFRTAYYEGSDADFVKAMELLKRYIRFECFEGTDGPIPDSDNTPNEQLLQRFQNEIVDAPELEGVTIPEVAELFKAWIISKGRQVGDSPRYQFCLLVDEEVLRRLVRLAKASRLKVGGRAVFSMKLVDSGERDDDDSCEESANIEDSNGDEREELDEENFPVWKGWMWAACWNLTEFWFSVPDLETDEMFDTINGKPLLLASAEELQ